MSEAGAHTRGFNTSSASIGNIKRRVTSALPIAGSPCHGLARRQRTLASNPTVLPFSGPAG
jgi:hypothetical protein